MLISCHYDKMPGENKEFWFMLSKVPVEDQLNSLVGLEVSQHVCR